MQEAIIRLAREDDFEAIFQLIKDFAAFQQSSGKVTIELQDMRKNKNLFTCFVAVLDNQIVGFATCFFACYSWSGKALYLDDLFVNNKYRNLGIGKRLLETVFAFARENNCIKVRWQVSGWNTNAIQFYKKMGALIDTVEINCDYLL